MNYENPAKRLLNILNEGKDSDFASLPTKQVWMGILSIEANNAKQGHSILLKRLGKVMEMPALIIEDVQEKCPHLISTCKHWETQISNALMNQNLDNPWHHFINKIDDRSIDSLKLIEQLLQNGASYEAIDMDALTLLRDELSEIYTKIMQEEDIDINIKKYLARHLRIILSSIDEYELTGAFPIIDAVEATIGHAYLNKDYNNYLKTSTGQTLLTALSSIANIVTIAAGFPQLTSSVMQGIEFITT